MILGRRLAHTSTTETQGITMTKLYVQDGVRAVVYNPATTTHEVLAPGRSFDSDDPFVKDNMWAFDAPVERATAEPGEKRNTRRP